MNLFAQKVTAITRLLAPWPALPVYALIYVTQRCDAKCKHCFLWRELNSHKNEELTVDEYEKLAASFGSLLQLTLTGGSPELRTDLPAIAHSFYRHCRPLNLTVCCNGYHTKLIRSHVETILRLCPGQTLTVGLSLDGLGAAHDELRGMKGLFERVTATFRELGELKREEPRLSLTCAVCVSELNWDTAEATADWAHENLPIDLLKPILIRGDPKDPSALGSRCVAAYLRVVAREEKHLAASQHSFLSAIVKAKEAIERKLIGDFQGQPSYRVNCAAGRQTTVIQADGTVMGCELREEQLGNLRQSGMDLSRLWQNSLAAEFRSKIRRERCACHHHCFLAPAVFRSPQLWPELARVLIRDLMARKP